MRQAPARQRLLPHDRFRATPALRKQLKEQGRRSNWAAEQIGVSRSYFSRLLSGERPISRADARVLAALVGGDFDVLFNVSGDTKNMSTGTHGGK